ncbi:MAG: hypothetical protein KDA44_01165 [Planctomycetales bacterium]|nr:hypothetical protein [Planctomycetales bacterium]
MLAKLHTFSLVGIDAAAVVAEVDVSLAAMPKTVLVGLPEQAVKENHAIDTLSGASSRRRSSPRCLPQRETNWKCDGKTPEQEWAAHSSSHVSLSCQSTVHPMQNP